MFLRHTSASLLIFENADLSARRDLEKFFEQLVPEDAGYFSHTTEGPDDMPSHIRMALTRTSESIPIAAGQLDSAPGKAFFCTNTVRGGRAVGRGLGDRNNEVILRDGNLHGAA